MIVIHRPDLVGSAVPPGPAIPRLVSENPPILTKAKRLAQALRQWNREGREITTKSVRAERTAVCGLCPHWRPKANLGLGLCDAPGCGCTRAKVWLKSEKCPLKKWPR
jgi:hypothetical protein